MNRWATDIRPWLILVLVVRLWGITSPPLEASHSWRQAFTNMVAGNLAEGPFDLLRPRTDMAGERPDVVASEFPGFNAIIALLERAAGPAHWYGRLVALLISTLGAWAFHSLLKARFGVRVAFLSAFVLLWSSWFLYGRKSMPDTFSIALMLFALYAVDRALRERRWAFLLLAAPLGALGGLCKIPAVVLFIPWVLMSLEAGLPLRWRVGAGAALAFAAMPVLWWYFHWQPHLLATYGNPLYFPYSIRGGWESLAPHAGKFVERITFSALMSHVAFLALLVGTWRVHREKLHGLQLLTLGTTLLLGYFVLKAGDVFVLHAYYILPAVPLMALLAGIGLDALPQGRWTIVALLIVMGEAMGIRWSDISGGSERAYLLRAAELADRSTTPADLVLTNGGLDPRPMYFLHRRGWSMDPEALTRPGTLDSLSALGLKAVFIDRHVADQYLPWPLVHEDMDWRVYKPAGP